MYWETAVGQDVLQGDWLPDCLVAKHPARFTPDSPQEALLGEYDLIVITQSCDLATQRSQFVAMCPIYSLTEFSDAIPEYAQKGKREELRKGRVEGLHLLASPTDPQDNQQALVVDFREIYSLPVEYVRDHAAQLKERWRLRSPYLEHFSQAFARFFMRVGLPGAIPPYKN
jgi:hypothetical protein